MADFDSMFGIACNSAYVAGRGIAEILGNRRGFAETQELMDQFLAGLERRPMTQMDDGVGKGGKTGRPTKKENDVLPWHQPDRKKKNKDNLTWMSSQVDSEPEANDFEESAAYAQLEKEVEDSEPEANDFEESAALAQLENEVETLMLDDRAINVLNELKPSEALRLTDELKRMQEVGNVRNPNAWVVQTVSNMQKNKAKLDNEVATLMLDDRAINVLNELEPAEALALLDELKRMQEVGNVRNPNAWIVQTVNNVEKQQKGLKGKGKGKGKEKGKTKRRRSRSR